MESKLLGAIMKKFLLNIYERTQKLTFFQGVVLTVCFTSLISIASTVLPNGLFSFSANTPISASEINANFEKVAGTVVLKANMTSPISVGHSTFITPSDCSTCKINRKRISFSSVAIGASQVQQDTDTDSNATTNGSLFSYYQIQESAWYEVRLISNTYTTINAPTTCDLLGCDLSVNSSLTVNVSDTLAQAKSSSMSSSINWQGSYKYLRDDNDNNGVNNDDGVFDPAITYPTYPPETRRFYLKAGQIIHVRFEGSYTSRDVTPDFTVGLNSLDLTIIKL